MVRGRRARFFARRGFAIVQEMHISPGPRSHPLPPCQLRGDSLYIKRYMEIPSRDT